MLKRIIYGLLAGVAVIVMIVWAPKFIISILVTLMAIGAIYEFMNAVGNMGYKPIKTFSYLSCIALLFIGRYETIQIYKWVGIFISILVIGVLIYSCFIRNIKSSIVDICFTFFGMIYITFLMSYLLETFYLKNAMNQDVGKYLIWFILFGACGTDVFAYFVGSKFGKHKLCPLISPKKTIEGAIGGIIGCVIIFVCYAFILNLNNSLGFRIQYLNIVAIGVVISAFAQLGDLVASSIKRNAEIKDFGNFLPGHGGIIDRIDSLLFVAPVTYYIFIIVFDLVKTI